VTSMLPLRPRLHQPLALHTENTLACSNFYTILPGLGSKKSRHSNPAAFMGSRA